jgi:multiple sugar transport system substrate-binding protein
MILVAGCGNNAPQDEGQKADDNENNQPVVLTLYQKGAKLSDEEFRTMIVEPVKQKYPHITIELIRTGKNNEPADLVASGQLPDMAFVSPGALTEFQKLQVTDDMSPYVKKYNLDLNKFDQNPFTTIYNICGAGKLCALPFSINPGAMFYNKDIFDKFAVPYPKDGMTWDDAIEVARKVTRLSDGVQYKGLNTGQIGWIATQLSTPRVDPATNMANLLHNDFQIMLQKFKEINDIPGNKRSGDAVNGFLQTQDTAMLTYLLGGTIGPLVEMHRAGKAFNWDMVSIPTFKEAPKKSYHSDAHLLMMSAKSPHKDEVFKVMQVLTDTPNQTKITQYGRVTSLNDSTVKRRFGELEPALKGKNIQAIYINEPANVPYHEYNELVNNALADALRDIMNGTKDVNTALRDAQDAANAAIRSAMNQ